VNEPLQTARLTLRRPIEADVQAVFEGYASDPEVTKYLSWPRHTSIDDTKWFVRFSDDQWARWPAGPLLMFSRADGALVGGTGLGFEAPDRAITGYVLLRSQWGKGFATEALGAMVDLARASGVRRLSATCHVDHRASSHVLEKCAFTREAVQKRQTVFPNLAPDPADVFLCTQILQP
jgi:[ribosomal protein S5]-alanine N-acetyltransferase